MAELNPPNLDIRSIEQLPLIIERDPPKLENQENWSASMHEFLALCLVKDYTQRPSCDILLLNHFITEKPVHKTLVANLLTSVLLKKAEKK